MVLYCEYQLEKWTGPIHTHEGWIIRVWYDGYMALFSTNLNRFNYDY
jgi:hypothetical protein